MARKTNIFDIDHAPYGRSIPGTSRQWKSAYEEVMGRAEAEQVLGGTRYTGSAENRARTILLITIEVLTIDAVKQSYRKIVMKVHPDHGGTDSAFKEVHAAYSLLMDICGS